MSDKQACPCCGTDVRVEGTTTKHFVPIADEMVKRALEVLIAEASVDYAPGDGCSCFEIDKAINILKGELNESK